ncbi:hypothetical protein [Hymenobacter cavernae]|uniref:DUF4239 domain-containing protein n=1 Tax=Hymenobacter cavernae TaxID=2044852 RepID=A0ABQ1UNI7_9BACT|nr:hypothetical protein [Hymenobacter cavernae]GGF22350.1 hypothetical protein GCM10011383_37480 [Hymenobacter cavernae]
MKTHFTYITGILITIIIILLTIDFGNNEKLVDYVSFALTITSIFLAVISIVYAYFSNSSFGELVGRLTNVSTEINSSSANLLRISRTLDKKIDAVPTSIKSLEDKFESFQSKANLPSSSSNVRSSLEAIESTSSNQTKSNLTKEELDTILDKAASTSLRFNSVTGLFSIYIAYLSKINNQKFNIIKVLEGTSISSGYALGQLIALQSLGILALEIDNSGDDTKFRTTFMRDSLIQEIEQVIMENIHKKENENRQTTFLSDMGFIKGYFDKSSDK